jgi:hypothetical protein
MQPTKILEQMNKIKKSIAVFAALLLMGSNVNAIAVVNYNCHLFADEMASEIGNRLVLDHAAEHQVFLDLYDLCVEATNPQ